MIRLSSFFAKDYRSLRTIRMDIGDVSVFVGENGAGKSNLYRALFLLRAAATGSFAEEIAAEGGMSSALWSGERRRGAAVRMGFGCELVDEESALSWHYAIEAGLKPPAASGFPFEPQIKTETLKVDHGRRPTEVMRRDAGAVFYRDGSGRMAEYPVRLLASETGLSMLGGSGLHPEVALLRDALAQWRFYHGFRSDALSPLRSPCLAVTAPMLDMEGANLAAVFATLAHIRGDTVDLDRAVDDAFPGARLHVPVPDTRASFGLVFPQFPKRIFSAQELSDGQIRFLALAAALLSYRLPPFVALNEPESSLHPDMLPALADLISRASRDAQIWIVTHSPELAAALESRCGVHARTVTRDASGATGIKGLRLTGGFERGE